MQPKRISKIVCALFLISTACNIPQQIGKETSAQCIQQAEALLSVSPTPITLFRSPRSAGGIQDFFSEGDYWWPNPADPDGPYIRRDGLSNPDNFNAHREAMYALSRQVATLTAAYALTRNKKYADKAMEHLHAWFISPTTRMNPSLLYAQAIKGVVTGRGIGIIDTIHLIEVAQSVRMLAKLGYDNPADLQAIRDWFNGYVTWLTTHPYGIDERDNGNNHSTWWIAQVAAFSKLAEREDLLEEARNQFKKYLAAQMDSTGAFPEELARTKPYSYSIFNLEGFSVTAHIASTPTDNLWTYQTPAGSLKKAWQYMLPYIQDKSTWPRQPDIQHYDELPIQTCGMLFAALAYKEKTWLQRWKQLSPVRKSDEIDRVNPLRQPLLWF